MRWLKQLLSRDSADTELNTASVNQDGRDDTLEYMEGYAEFTEWEWDRADEYSYDHYTQAIEDVKDLKRQKEHAEAEDLLLWCIDYVEAEAEAEYECTGEAAVSRAYYRHLAIIYRKDDRHDDEVDVLKRYLDTVDRVDESPHDELVDRFDRARELAIDS